VNVNCYWQDIQKYIEEAAEGVIFFSMGSNLKSSDLPDKKLRGILEAFSKLKQRVLWKWEGENLPGKPSNVMVAKWLPQSDILGKKLRTYVYMKLKLPCGTEILLNIARIL
jgi:UDP:flavonoid glycosyltransferase YjiC (YdhE family)